MDLGLLWLSIFGLCFYTFALILSGITAVAVISLKLYHSNLRTLLINVSVTHCIILLLLTTVEIMYMLDWNGRQPFNDLTVVCAWATAFNLMCLFFERLAASLYDKKYEKMCITLPWLGIMLVICDWSFAGIFFTLVFVDLTSHQILTIIVLGITVTAMIIFSFMPSLTYKRYTQAQTKEFSLTQRYQMSENYRSAKLLTKVVWCFALVIILSVVFYVLSTLDINNWLFFNIFNYIFMSQTICYPILVMYYETKVRDFILCKKSKRNFVAKTITGRNLVVATADEQREIYFQSYRQAWS